VTDPQSGKAEQQGDQFLPKLVESSKGLAFAAARIREPSAEQAMLFQRLLGAEVAVQLKPPSGEV
jgi:hypothetical protein